MRAVLFILKLGLKILAAPVVLALMLFTWLCFGLLYVSSFIFGLASAVVALLGIAVLVTYSPQNGLILLVIAFLVSPLGLPMVFVVAVVLFALALLVQEKTRFGQYLYALSENPQAVKESGVKNGLVRTCVFVFSAFMAAFGGIIYVLTVYKSGQPSMGTSFFLNGFTCVFLGAMVLKLGKTQVVGTFIGALVLAALTSGLTMQGAGFAVGQVIKGLLLIMGVAVVTIYRRRTIPRGRKMKYE